MEQQEQNIKNKKKRSLMIGAAVTVVLAALLIGLTYAWFFHQSDIATMVSIAPPSEISIRGPHGKTLTALDLSYTDNVRVGEKVTVQRVISVSTDAKEFQLEIAHTTNSKDLTFKLYKANESENGTIADGGYAYTLDKDNPVKGRYINLAGNSGNYKYATTEKHNDNYGSYSNVQAHAEPLYWLADAYTKSTDEIEKNSLIYYVLEISWTETAEKETDIFYVLAKNS